MFNIFKKKSKIHIDCFTHFKGITKLFPIEPADSFVPNWFKNLPTTADTGTGVPGGTLKLCPGISETFKTGIVIPVWCDLFVDFTNNKLRTEPAEMASQHPNWQWGNNPAFKDFHHLKIGSPWKFKEKTGAKFIMTNMFWNHPSIDYIIPNGMIEFKYQTTTNINIWIPKGGFAPKKSFTLVAGAPLVQIIPLEDKEIVIHMHEVSPEEYHGNELDYIFSQSGQYYKRKQILTKRGYHKE
jgi:hypothetical protein